MEGSTHQSHNKSKTDQGYFLLFEKPFQSDIRHKMEEKMIATFRFIDVYDIFDNTK